jgi:branched-chain amino acid transport system substrate-binding protein
MEGVDMKRKLLATLVGTALLGMVSNLALAQTAKPGAISGDKVKIGVMNDMSGLYADIGGPGSVEAARMAIQDFGGKVLGKPVELVFVDHLNKPDVGASKAREWYDTEGVDMIVDVPTSSVAIAVGKVAGEKKRVLMVTGGASSRLTNEDCNAYTVHYAYDTYALANGTGKAIVKTGGKTWFFITADYAFGKSLEDDTAAVVKANGGTVLGHVLHPLNASDFSSYMLQAQASKAQIIGLANAGGDTINAVKAANEFGLTKTQSLAGLLLFITDIHSLGLKTAQGMMLTSAWYWDTNDETRKFGRRFFEKVKRMPTFDQAGVYSAVTTYLKAVKTVGTDDADKVMAELKKAKINDLFVKNGYIRQDGRMIKEMYLMQVKKPEESKYPWDYYKLKATIPAEEAFQPLSKSTCPMIKK